MNVDFSFILLTLACISGLLVLLDKVYWRKRRAESELIPWYIEYSKSLVPIFLTVLVVRSFVVEPYLIPSASLEPTLKIGDFILVNKYYYGLRLPIIHKKIADFHQPQVGDIAVFRWPVNPKLDYIKRIVAVPGDTIEYRNKQLVINGKVIVQRPLGFATDNDGQGNVSKVEKRAEMITGHEHQIIIRPEVVANNFKQTIPEGYYFVMGDNRDDSSDSRIWGLVPESHLVGRAYTIWMSWDNLRDKIRWQRIGKAIT